MKYYVVEISEGDSKIKGKGMYEYETRDEAVATYHSKIGTAMKSDLYTSHRICVLNDTMAIEMANVFVRGE